MSDDSGTTSRKKRRVSNEYQKPETITVEITDPVTIEQDGKPQYTTYKITTETYHLDTNKVLMKTTLPNFKNKNCTVRRRYNDFAWLRAHIKEKMDERGKRLTIAELPSSSLLSMFGSARFDPEFIDERMKGLQVFLSSVVNHPWARFEEGLHKFLEDQDFECKD